VVDHDIMMISGGSWYHACKRKTPPARCRGNKIYVKGQLHGQADISGFTLNEPPSNISSNNMDTSSTTTSSSSWIGLLGPKVCVQNCRSLAKNLLFFPKFYIRIWFSNYWLLSETWLSEDITDHEVLPQPYTFYRKDRSTRGGGVMLAISSAFN